MTLPVEATPFLLSGLLFSMLAIYSFQQRHRPGSLLFGWVMVSDVWWVLSYAMDLASTSVEAKTFWLQVKYLGSAPNAFIWLAFILEMTGHVNWLRSRWFRALWLLPIALIIVVFTNSWHNWFWIDIWTVPGEVDSFTSHGPVYPIYLLVTSITSLVSLALILQHSLFAVHFYRRRNLLLIAGLLCPHVGLFFDLGQILPALGRVDQVILWLTPAAILMSIAIYRYQALDILPLAQRLVFENINSGVVVVDPLGEVVAMNEFASQHWSNANDDQVHLHEMIPQTTALELTDGAEWEIQSGHEWYLVIVSELSGKAEGILGHALVFIDITERKEAEQARTEAVTARSQFFATISHELRTPLHGATGLLQLALDTNLTEQQRDYLERAQASSRQLLLLINDVLDQSRIEAGQLSFERTSFDLSALVEQLRSVHSIAAQERGITLTMSADNLGILLIGDPLRLTQVLTNLIGNGIKFTQRGHVDVTTQVLEDTVNRVKLEFSVTDTGIGIAPDRIDTLFDPFTQADSSTTRRFGGSGLGLTISRALVQGMGGDLEVTSIPDQGSTFSFSLWFDIADEESSGSSTEQASTPDLRGYRILLVDDTSVNLEIVQALLKDTGAIVDAVYDGDEAVTIAKRNSYDIVLMDIHMPHVDGHAATRALRATAEYADIPIVAMTASVLSEDRELALESGMVDFVAKPFTQGQLFEVIRRHLPDAAEKQSTARATSNFSNQDAALSGADDLAYGVDTKKGVAALGGNRERYFELLEELVEEAKAQVVAMQSAPDIETLGNCAHALVGAASMLGANLVAEAAGALQTPPQSQADDLETRIKLIPALDKAVETLSSYLAQRHMNS